MVLLYLVAPLRAGCAGTGRARPQPNRCSPKTCHNTKPPLWLLLGCLQVQAKGRAAVDLCPQTVVDAASVVFLPCFPPRLAHAPSAADAAQRKNPGGLTCQELSAAFYQLLCIPPLSPPAASHELPKKIKIKMNVSAVGVSAVHKAWPGQSFAEGQGAAGVTSSVALGTSLPSRTTIQNGIGLLFLCATAADGMVSRRGLGRETLPKPRSSG